MSSPARKHFERTSAASSQAAESDTPRDANGYELMLHKLATDKRRLKEVQSLERKAEVKREILPEYEPWIEGVLTGKQGVQDDVLMTVMVWRIDAGDYLGALEIARYAIEHKLAMPDQYKRTTACLIAEEIADAAIKAHDSGIEINVEALIEAIASVNTELSAWRIARIAEGRATLAAVPAELIDDVSINVNRYQRAVGCFAKASLIERYRDFDTTAAGNKKADQLENPIDDLRRDARWAISDILGVGRTTVELI